MPKSRQRKKKRPAALSPAPKKPTSDQPVDPSIASTPVHGSERIGAVDLSQTHLFDRHLTDDELQKVSLTRRRVVRLYKRAIGWDWVTRQKGKTGGVIGSTPLRVLETLVFEAAYYSSGEFASSFEGIADQARMSVSSARKALSHLQSLGIIAYDHVPGQPSSPRTTYAIFEETLWKDYATSVPLIDAYERERREDMAEYWASHRA